MTTNTSHLYFVTLHNHHTNELTTTRHSELEQAIETYFALRTEYGLERKPHQHDMLTDDHLLVFCAGSSEYTLTVFDYSDVFINGYELEHDQPLSLLRSLPRYW